MTVFAEPHVHQVVVKLTHGNVASKEDAGEYFSCIFCLPQNTLNESKQCLNRCIYSYASLSFGKRLQAPKLRPLDHNGKETAHITGNKERHGTGEHRFSFLLASCILRHFFPSKGFGNLTRTTTQKKNGERFALAVGTKH